MQEVLYEKRKFYNFLDRDYQGTLAGFALTGHGRLQASVLAPG